MLTRLLDLIWPFCRREFGRKHVLVIGRILTIAYEVTCEACGRRWMCHRHYSAMLPWDDDVERFFQKRAASQGAMS